MSSIWTYSICKKMKYNKNLYFIVSSSCQMTKGYSKTLLQDFSRKSLEYIPNDYYMITKLLDRHQIGEIAEKISDSSMGNFEKYINFMIDKEYAFLTKDISLFPPKCHVVHDSLFPINDAIVEFNPIVSNMEEMYSARKHLPTMLRRLGRSQLWQRRRRCMWPRQYGRDICRPDR